MERGVGRTSTLYDLRAPKRASECDILPDRNSWHRLIRAKRRVHRGNIYSLQAESMLPAETTSFTMVKGGTIIVYKERTRESDIFDLGT